MNEDDRIAAVREAAVGNIESYEDYGCGEVITVSRLDAAQFVNDLRSAGWEIVQAQACEAVIYHGPGHQSRTKCDIRGPHTDHCATLFGEHTGIYEWTEPEVFAEWGGGTHPKET